MALCAMSFVGFHNSGKTTLVSQLATRLQARGRKVGMIKMSGHGFDLGETDTGKLAATGCPVAGIGPEQTMVVFPQKRRLGAVASLLDADTLLVEGGKNLGVLPRVVLTATEPQADEDLAALENGLAVACWGPECLEGVPRLKDLDQLADLVLERGFWLPGLDCGACGREDCAALAREIVAGTAQFSDCRTTGTSFTVRVNNQPLAMNPFVATIMASTLKGMLCQLKGYAPGTIDIHLEEA
jgi:molybdopterin-guanine dinucleotide biosynthesis adapter protein